MDLALFGGSNEIARSVPQDGHQLVAAFGGINLDLSNLVLPESLRMSALVAFGGIKLIVPPGTDVIMRGFAMFGGRDVKRRSVSGSTRSVIYLNAVAMFGAVEVIEAEPRNDWNE